MNRTLIIGAGGVGRVVAHICAQDPETFPHLMLASRTKAKCDAIAAELSRPIETAQLDADKKEEVAQLIRSFQADLVIHVALPYQDLSIMEACLEAGAHYLDTANYEPLESAKFEYSWQWAYRERFEKAGLMALLGCGFDPGVTNVFTAYLAKHHFDTIRELDIIDVNGGDHGKPFATNFNPEINIREVTATCRHYENGSFIESDPMSLSRSFTCPEGLGTYTIYRLYHEELESLVQNYPSLEKAQFWMSFSDSYLKHLEVLQNVGMTSIQPITYQGQEIVPLQFLKAVLPEPASLGPDTRGETCIGVQIRGEQGGKEKQAYIYNICSHQEAYKKTNSQGVSFTTGVPAAVGAKMILQGIWKGHGVFNMETFDPDPFLKQLEKDGLSWKIQSSD